MEAEDVSQFRRSIMEGEWTVAESMLTRLGVTDTDGLMVGGIHHSNGTRS